MKKILLLSILLSISFANLTFANNTSLYIEKVLTEFNKKYGQKIKECTQKDTCSLYHTESIQNRLKTFTNKENADFLTYLIKNSTEDELNYYIDWTIYRNLKKHAADESMYKSAYEFLFNKTIYDYNETIDTINEKKVKTIQAICDLNDLPTKDQIIFFENGLKGSYIDTRINIIKQTNDDNIELIKEMYSQKYTDSEIIVMLSKVILDEKITPEIAKEICKQRKFPIIDKYTKEISKISEINKYMHFVENIYTDDFKIMTIEKHKDITDYDKLTLLVGKEREKYFRKLRRKALIRDIFIETPKLSFKCLISPDAHLTNIWSRHWSKTAMIVGSLNPINAVITIFHIPFLPLIDAVRTIP